MLAYIFIAVMIVVFITLINVIPSVREEIGIIVFRHIFLHNFLRKIFPAKGRSIVVNSENDIIAKTTKDLWLSENPLPTDKQPEEFFNESFRNGKLPREQDKCPKFNPDSHFLKTVEMTFSFLGKNRGCTLVVTFLQKDPVEALSDEAPTSASIEAIPPDEEGQAVILNEIAPVDSGNFEAAFNETSEIDQKTFSQELADALTNIEEELPPESYQEKIDETYFYILNISFTYPQVEMNGAKKIFAIELPLINHFPEDPSPDESEWYSEEIVNPQFPSLGVVYSITDRYNENNEKVFSWDEVLGILHQLNFPLDSHVQANEIRFNMLEHGHSIIPLSIYPTKENPPEAPPGTKWLLDLEFTSAGSKEILFTAHILTQQDMNPHFYEYFETMTTTT